MTPARIHGGTDAMGVPLHDFSTNSNACDPCPQALLAVQQADARHYPDASYADLRTQLAAFHRVGVGRVLLAGSASEFIYRTSAWLARESVGRGKAVCLPTHAYGDYAQAAHAWGLALAAQPDQAQLVWACEPSSPLGQAHRGWPQWLKNVGKATSVLPSAGSVSMAAAPVCVLDCAYAPLRLSGAPSLHAAQLDQVWQLFTPNKALGLTGVRAAYVIAPHASDTCAQSQIDTTVSALNQLAPSWPVGAHGVAMLQAWVTPEAQAWLAQCVPTLRDWKARQISLLQDLGWTCLPSEANFFCARAPRALDLAALRSDHGIKLRDCTFFGLPGWVRVGVLPPMAQDALLLAISR